ncbi:A24 family peptidase [Vibrio mimicus]|uniref:A24 family peptidase n=1 Tax=Vibrio mimicus TaxID=674 RepID=UPI0011DA0958|nr:A24 family peptidase [Vibrio mimicus]TXY05417.1 prepilin peptidase [Vibrio mimicus]
MVVNSLIWFCLLVVAVYDARDNRIPNIWLFPLTLLACVHSLSAYGLSFLLSSLAAGAVYFAAGLLLYYFRAMSPGDVKLLGVVGMIVGWEAMGDAAYWITISAGMVAALFMLLHYAQNPDSLSQVVGRYSQQAMSGNIPILSSLQSRVSMQAKLTMPFAPAVVIGLAMFHYF